MPGQDSVRDESDSLASVLKLDRDGLIPAIAQQHDTGEILMMAWMSVESLAETLQTGRVTYWSRSRKAFWRKGESSGQVQTLIDARIDCDGDTLVLLVDQEGAACHTGRRSCFYRRLAGGDDLEFIAEPIRDPKELYGIGATPD